jgi:hypothetical protein
MREKNYSYASSIKFPWTDAPKHKVIRAQKETQNLISLSANQEKQNRVDHPLAL